MKTMIRVYDIYDEARQVVNALEALGIPAEDISIIANKSVIDLKADVNNERSRIIEGVGTGAGIGTALGGGAGLLAGLGLLSIPAIGPVVAAGWLAAATLGAVSGAVSGAVAGGIVGALVDLGVSQEDAHVYAETVRRGGTLVSVRYDEARERMVIEAMDRHNPIDTTNISRAAGRAPYPNRRITTLNQRAGIPSVTIRKVVQLRIQTPRRAAFFEYTALPDKD